MQLKYYALDLCYVRTGWKGEDESKEVLELVQIEHLTAAEMADVRCSALALEVWAYVTSKLVDRARHRRRCAETRRWCLEVSYSPVTGVPELLNARCRLYRSNGSEMTGASDGLGWCQPQSQQVALPLWFGMV